MPANPSGPADERKPDGLTRRTLMKLSVVGILGASFGVGASAGLTRWGRSVPSAYRFFTLEEATRLIAICEQIIPRDDAPSVFARAEDQLTEVLARLDRLESATRD